MSKFLIHAKHIRSLLKFNHFNLPKIRQSHGHTLEKTICSNRSPQKVMKCACKSVLITGGAEGIGLAIAHEILGQKAQRVALIGINNCIGRSSVNTLNCAYGKNKAVFFNCDVQCTKDVIRVYEKVIKELGHLDIVINAAGVFDGCNWESEILTNLTGTVSSSLEAYKIMSKESGGAGGTILNVTGLHGIKPLHAAPTLAGSLGGVVAFSRSLGHKINVKKSEVRVVTLCTGITNTNFVKDAENRALNERFKVQMEVMLCKVQRQNADVCGKSAVHALEHGKDGSVWVVEGSKLYSLNVPKWKSYAKLESQLI